MTNDLICSGIKNEAQSKIGLFLGAINSANGLLYGGIFNAFRSIRKTSDLPSISGMIGEIDSKVNDMISSVNSALPTLNDVIPSDAISALSCLNVGIGSFNPNANLRMNLQSMVTDDILNGIFKGMPGCDLFSHLSNFEMSVPLDLIDDVLKIAGCVSSICSGITSLSQVDIESKMNSVAMNINSEIDLNSEIITKKFKFKDNQNSFISDMATVGRKISSIQTLINV